MLGSTTHGSSTVKLRTTLISIPTEGVWLDGALAHAPDVRGLVVILHSDTYRVPNAQPSHLADALQAAGYATMAVNLLTRNEASRDPDASFNVPRMTLRLLAAAEWIGHQPPLAGLGIGLVASDTGCGVAIRAAVNAPDRFDAIVCLGGRPDLAGAGPLRTLATPVLFVTRAQDRAAAILASAYELITTTRDWRLAGDGESGARADEAIAGAAADWLQHHLRAPARVEAHLSHPANS